MVCDTMVMASQEEAQDRTGVCRFSSRALEGILFRVKALVAALVVLALGVFFVPGVATGAHADRCINDYTDVWHGNVNQGDTFDDSTVDGDFDRDCADGKSGNDEMDGEQLRDYLLGGENSDAIHGGGEGDWLYGEDGDDFLYGDGGDDIIRGASGFDLCRGGDGQDDIGGDCET